MILFNLPSTRTQAITLGISQYYTGNPCIYGHNSPKFSVNGTCVECSRLKSSVKYHKNKALYCEKAKAWCLVNKEKRREISRKYAKRNAEKQKRYNKENKEKIREIKKRWKKKNKEAVNSHTRNRRARLKKADGLHTKADIDSLYKKQQGFCVACNADLSFGYHVDHIVAISKGGSNWPSNLQLLCPKCNVSKSNIDHATWLRNFHGHH